MEPLGSPLQWLNMADREHIFADAEEFEEQLPVHVLFESESAGQRRVLVYHE